MNRKAPSAEARDKTPGEQTEVKVPKPPKAYDQATVEAEEIMLRHPELEEAVNEMHEAEREQAREKAEEETAETA